MSTLGGWRQQDWEFKANLDCLRPCLNYNKNKNEKGE